MKRRFLKGMSDRMLSLCDRNNGLEDLELVPEGDLIWLWGFGEYESSSVLAGQYRQVRIDSFESLEEAKAECPNVPVRGDGSVPEPCHAAVSTCPPDDWSPDDAGESWDEV